MHDLTSPTVQNQPPAENTLKHRPPLTSHLLKLLAERHLQPILFVFVQPTPHSVNVYAWFASTLICGSEWSRLRTNKHEKKFGLQPFQEVCYHTESGLFFWHACWKWKWHDWNPYVSIPGSERVTVPNSNENIRKSKKSFYNNEVCVIDFLVLGDRLWLCPRPTQIKTWNTGNNLRSKRQKNDNHDLQSI